MAKIAIIGGSGLEKLSILESCEVLHPQNSYGESSSPVTCGCLGDHQIFILSRHGANHETLPSHVNYRANIAFLKERGVDAIFATTATGSLVESIHPGDLVFPNQFIDHTFRRINTFYETAKAGESFHTPMAEPFDPRLRTLLIQQATKLALFYHSEATLITIEGPRFSTRAESMLYRQWGAHLINMSIATECALANEALIPYAAIAMATDYDCWKENELAVSHDLVLKNFQKNVSKVTQLLVEVIKNY